MLEKVLISLYECIEDIRKQNFYIGCEKFNSVSGMIPELLEDLDKSLLMELLKQMFGALEIKDFIFFADILELNIIPLLLEKVEDKQIVINDQFVIEATSNGEKTIKVCESENRSFYIHSNVNPYNEGKILAKTVIHEKLDYFPEKYVILGLGLGYHIKALQDYIDYSISIEVYEPSADIIEIFNKYGIISSENIIIVHDPNGEKYLSAIQNKHVKSLMLYPSIKLVNNEIARSKLEELFAVYNGIKQESLQLNLNFQLNKKNAERNADELLYLVRNKTAIIVAAGPSLDKCMDYLKELDRDKNIILAVGTVFAKLIKYGISPDIVFYLDGKPRTYKQMAGMEEERIPVVVAGAANWRFASNYTGPKYLAYHNDFYEHGENVIFETGGSVSTLCLDFAIKGGAKRIVCTGLNLGYGVDGSSHSAGTMDYQKSDNNDMINQLHKVKGFSGEDVYSTRLFDIYRDWIEKRIDRCKDAEFINISEGGSYIKGMKHLSLSEYRDIGE